MSEGLVSKSLSPGVGRPAASGAIGISPALVFLLPALLAAAVTLFAPQVMNDGDTLWHVAAGQWMLDHGQPPQVDPFSYTIAGQPWHDHEWLSEVVMALAYRAAGWTGVALLGAAAAGATIGLLGRELVRRLDPAPALAALIVAAGCIAPSLVLRPHLLMLPLLVLWTGSLIEARVRGRAPPLGLAALATVWANAHGSVVFALASALCALITPFGVDGLLYPLKVSGMTTLSSITEWRSPDFSTPQPLEIALLAGLFVIAWRGVRIPLLRLVLLLGLLHLSLQHQRHQMLLAVVGVLILAEAAGRTPAAEGSAPKLGPIAWLGAALGLALVALRLIVPFSLQQGPTLPIAALDQVPPSLRAQPVLNDYGMGGYLIFRGVKPFIDGRADAELYGDAFSARYDAVVSNRAALEETLAERHVAWTLFPPSSPAVRLLDAEPGWRRLYSDPYAVVHIRR